MNRITVDANDLMRTISTLAHFPARIRQRAIRIGLNKAGSIIRSKIVAPVDTGALQKSFAIKVKQTRATKDWHCTVGANRKAGIRRSKKAKRSDFMFFRPKAELSAKQKKRRPSRYLHLVNNGTSRIAPKFFMQHAAAAAGPEVIATVAARIVSEIQGSTNVRS